MSHPLIVSERTALEIARARWRLLLERDPDLTSIDPLLREPLRRINELSSVASVFSCEGHGNDEGYLMVVTEHSPALLHAHQAWVESLPTCSAESRKMQITRVLRMIAPDAVALGRLSTDESHHQWVWIIDLPDDLGGDRAERMHSLAECISDPLLF